MPGDVRPDESGPEPRCSTECPALALMDSQTGHAACVAMGTGCDLGYPCRVRELVALSRRRWVLFSQTVPSEAGEYRVLAQLDDGRIAEQIDHWSDAGLGMWMGWARGLEGSVIAWEPRHA